MKAEYQNWISAFALKRKGIVRGACMVATAEMVAAFPELTRVVGFCNGTEHFWCVVTETGDVVDPTAAQFGSNVILNYEPFMAASTTTYRRIGTIMSETMSCIYCGRPLSPKQISNRKQKMKNRGWLKTSHGPWCSQKCFGAWRSMMGLGHDLTPNPDRPKQLGLRFPPK